MSITLMALVFKMPVPASRKLLLLSLADFANDEGGSIFPSVRTLAKKSSMTVRSVQRGLRALENLGWLAQVAPSYHHAPAEYRLNVLAIRELLRGDRVSGDNLSADGVSRGEVTHAPRGVTSTPSRGDTVSPDPSVEEPPVEPPSRPSETLWAAVAKAASPPSPRARIKFDPDSGITGVTDEDLQRWAKLAPGVDVRREIEKAAEWLLNNPHRRRSNVAQFVANWLSRAQDDAARRPSRVHPAGGDTLSPEALKAVTTGDRVVAAIRRRYAG